jgi:hypothetical protein
MLYDPKWRRRDVGDLAAWLETHDPEETYNFRNCGGCLIAQWMGNNNHFEWSPEIMAIYAGRDPGLIARGSGHPEDWTFGAALARARAAVAAVA